MPSYRQLILFGSPGTGKSHKVKDIILPKLSISKEDISNVIRTVFHPEYTYGDFMGKLLPLTKDGKVEYKYYAGDFLKAISKAYKNILNAPEGSTPQPVVLVIDEINRGNSAAIFGIVFQLLDRELDGWSTYDVDISDMEFDEILERMGVRKGFVGNNQERIYQHENQRYNEHDFNAFLHKRLKISLNKIRIPGNMSIIATMNTSDSSIYHMDSAFKRRWAWQYIDVDSNTVEDESLAFVNRTDWQQFVSKLNLFIKSQNQFIRKAEDKQIGYYFIQDEQISKSSIQNKVMFFVWDSVFTTSKKPLVDLMGLEEKSLVTFGDFAKQVDIFINKISTHK